ncbi:MAG: hypothetical protein Q9162_000181 [Coniocarpon cinnabarinum]
MDSKRASNFEDGGPKAKKAKTGGLSFAQRMMAKMGHVEGQGLGRGGEGMLNPIAVKLRPQGAGVGTVKEKTPQQKSAERRAAEQRGEEYVDSSEEERRERRRRKQAAKSKTFQTHASTTKPVRNKVRTVAEIEDEEGLQVPDIFKSFIDYTGSAPKQITSSADLASSKPESNQYQSAETEKLVRKSRVELEAFADTWHELQNRKTFFDTQESEANRKLESYKSSEVVLSRVEQLADQLSSLKVDMDKLDEQLSLLHSIRQAESTPEVNQDNASDTAIAFVGPCLTQLLNDWNPLSSDSPVLSRLHSLKSALVPFVRSKQPKTEQNLAHALHDASQQLDAYDSIMFSTWLPKVRSYIINDWNPVLPQPLLQLIELWRPLLPEFLIDIVVNQLAASKLIQALKSWKPRTETSNKPNQNRPHEWLFPWLAHLSEYHMDPRSSDGLLAEVKRKFRTLLGSWNPNNGILPDLSHWMKVDRLHADLVNVLQLKLLPRLAQYLNDELQIDPSDQDRTPMDVALQWEPFFTASKFSRIFIDAFFPKWFEVLRIWLSSEPNYEEVGLWYEWWRSVFPESLNAEPSIDRLWKAGLEMMSKAMESPNEAIEDELHQMDTAAVNLEQVNGSTETPIKDKSAQEITDDSVTTKDLLEELCEQEDLLLLPLRKAHPETGHPLLRITASASGGGGVVVYIAGDVIMAQSRRDRQAWEPLDIYSEGTLRRLGESR